MKKFLALCCSAIAVILVSVVHPRVAPAADWEQFLDELSDTGIQDGVQEDGTVYSMNYTYTVYNKDGVSNNFGNQDQVTLRLENMYNSEQFLEFSGTRSELTSWAQRNKDELYAIIFMSSPDRSIAGESNGSVMSSQGVSRLLMLPMHDIKLAAQYDFFKVGPAKITTTGPSGLISYVGVGESGRHALGVDIPFRSLVADDKVGTSFMYLMLNPFYEYSVTGGPNRYTINAGVNLGLTSMDSDIFGDTAGFFNYGFNLGAGASRTLARRLEGRVGLSYQFLERYVPESKLSGDFQWIGEALNDADAEQTITPGIGFTAWIAPETASVDISALYVYQLGSNVPSEYKDQTIVNAFVTFTPSHWQIKLGYKTSFGLEDFEDHSIIASLRYLW